MTVTVVLVRTIEALLDVFVQQDGQETVAKTIFALCIPVRTVVNAFQRVAVDVVSVQLPTMVTIVENFIDPIPATICIVGMDNVVKVFASVKEVIPEYSAMLHLTYVLVLIVIMDNALKVAVRVLKVIWGITAIL